MDFNNNNNSNNNHNHNNNHNTSSSPEQDNDVDDDNILSYSLMNDDDEMISEKTQEETSDSQEEGTQQSDVDIMDTDVRNPATDPDHPTATTTNLALSYSLPPFPSLPVVSPAVPDPTARTALQSMERIVAGLLHCKGATRLPKKTIQHAAAAVLNFGRRVAEATKTEAQISRRSMANVFDVVRGLKKADRNLTARLFSGGNNNILNLSENQVEEMKDVINQLPLLRPFSTALDGSGRRGPRKEGGGGFRRHSINSGGIKSPTRKTRKAINKDGGVHPPSLDCDYWRDQGEQDIDDGEGGGLGPENSRWRRQRAAWKFVRVSNLNFVQHEDATGNLDEIKTSEGDNNSATTLSATDSNHMKKRARRQIEGTPGPTDRLKLQAYMPPLPSPSLRSAPCVKSSYYYRRPSSGILVERGEKRRRGTTQAPSDSIDKDESGGGQATTTRSQQILEDNLHVQLVLPKIIHSTTSSSLNYCNVNEEEEENSDSSCLSGTNST